MHLARVLRTRRYGLLALGIGLAMAAALPLVQNIGQWHNLDLWFTVLAQNTANLSLYIAFSALFGASVALALYNWRHRTCGLRRASPGAAGAVMAFFLGVCPGCASLASLLFPAVAGGAGAAAAFAVGANSTWFFLASTGLVVLAIALNRGFSRQVPGVPTGAARTL
ncbi:MAG: hypothetical protein QXO51_05475 [Halobacteria archaeon]